MKRITFWIALTGVFLLVGRVEAQTIYVPFDQPTISQAIAHASQQGTSTIVVTQNWVESGPIIMDRKVTITHNAGLTATISGSGLLLQASALSQQVTSSGSVVDGLTFSRTGGGSTQPMVDFSYKATLKNCVVLDNGKKIGVHVIGVYGPNAAGSLLQNNTIELSYGGSAANSAIYVETSTYSNRTTLTGNTIRILNSTSARDGIGCYIDAYPDPEVAPLSWIGFN